MASYPAPSQNIDFFNPFFFTQDETALTVGQANKLYFKRSGGIITGPVSAPSLTLNGTNVETKLLEIDANSNKLTDISYNNNTTSILNDLSINGILKLPNLPNVGNDISSNKQKTTKISYDANTSVTTIADTLKAGSTLIVGSQNYNASDEFYKLTGITRGATPQLTITDAVDLHGTLNLPNHGNIDTILTNFDEILVNMSYDSPSNLLTISSNVKIPQNLELGTITDVEQKIIDISNTTTNLETILTDVSYVNSTTIVGGKLNIEEATGTPHSASGGSLTLIHNNNAGTSSIVFKSKNNVDDYGYISYQDDWNNGINLQRSLLEIGVQNNGPGGITIDNIALMPSGFVGINTRTPQKMLDVNGDTIISGNLQLNTITDVEQKIIDISNTATNLETNVTGISYNTIQDLTTIDNSLNVTGNLQLGTITDVEQKIIDISNNAGGTPYITYDAVNDKLDVEKDMDLSLNDLNCRFMRPYLNGAKYWLSQNHNSSVFEFRNGGHHIDAFNPGSAGTGRDMYINYYAQAGVFLGSDLSNSTTTVNGNLHIIETNGTAPTATGGSLLLEHNNNGGKSSIVFKSAQAGTDYGYISYQDDYLNQSGKTRSLLELGSRTNGPSAFVDNIALMPSGFLGINRRDPAYMLDLNGDMRTYDTIIGERPFLNTDGNGISIKPLTNPSLNGGSIFDVRTSLDSCRLFVGRGVTSCGFNNFCFGWDVTASNGTEGDPTNYSGILGTDGSVDCTEIKVNSIPINSFTAFKLGHQYQVRSAPSTTIDWGRNRILQRDDFSNPIRYDVSYSYQQQFTYNASDHTITCNSGFFGSYEILATVVYRNDSGARHNPCIGISISSSDPSGDLYVVVNNQIIPDWSKCPYGQTPYSMNYCRMTEGRLATLNSTRIHNFTNSLDKVTIRQFIRIANGSYGDQAGSYEITSASIRFKYLGNIT